MAQFKVPNKAILKNKGLNHRQMLKFLITTPENLIVDKFVWLTMMILLTWKL
jgi:hypothetical protein